MGGTWKDDPKYRWWQTFGRCGRCRRFHWLKRKCPHCGSGKVF